MSSYKCSSVQTIKVPRQLIDDPSLPFIFDDFSLALALGVKCKTLWYCIKSKKRLYKRFTIPKSNGRLRVIYSPKRCLKYVQNRISEVVLQPLPLLPCVGAYVKGKSCRDTALQHVQKSVLVKIDLKDFFPSHRRSLVRYFFKRKGYSHDVASLLADLCTVEEDGTHIVPQGSPASPALCNHIAQMLLDTRILNVLEGGDWTYTRYADDLMFSHPLMQTALEVDILIKTIFNCVKEANYRINYDKLKVYRRSKQQRVLGMVVNEHPNIAKATYRKYRGILHNCGTQGFAVNATRYGMYDVDEFILHLQGKVNYFCQVNPNKGQKLKRLLMEALEVQSHDEDTP